MNKNSKNDKELTYIDSYPTNILKFVRNTFFITSLLRAVSIITNISAYNNDRMNDRLVLTATSIISGLCDQYFAQTISPHIQKDKFNSTIEKTMKDLKANAIVLSTLASSNIVTSIAADKVALERGSYVDYLGIITCIIGTLFYSILSYSEKEKYMDLVKIKNENEKRRKRTK